MRRLGLLISSLIAAGTLFATARAFATTDKTIAQRETRPALKIEKDLAPRIFTPAKATKQGQLDDRLIRPQHHNYDASAGLIG